MIAGFVSTHLIAKDSLSDFKLDLSSKTLQKKLIQITLYLMPKFIYKLLISLF